MNDIRTVIIEDDFKVAEINKCFTEQVEGFEVISLSRSAAEALSYLESNTADLLILDMYLPDMNGTELLKEVRKKEYPVDIIAITAAHDSRTIESSLRYGVFDFIIKPFIFGRYRDSLLKYRNYRESLENRAEYNQQKLNELTSYMGSSSEEALPKGITRYTLDRIRSVVVSLHHDFTLEEVLGRVSFSRITARRYLEFLCESGVIYKSFKYQKVGRPVVVYSKKDPTTSV
jgi:two-component system CitB family response regulator